MIKSYRDLDVWKKSISLTKEFLYHLNVAYGSLAETETHAILANELGFISSATLEKLLINSNEIGKMLNGLVRSLEGRDLPDPRAPAPEPFKKEAV